MTRWRYLEPHGVAVLMELPGRVSESGFDQGFADELPEANGVLFTCPDCRDTGYRLFDRYHAGVPYVTGSPCEHCERGLAIARGDIAATERKRMKREEWQRGNPRNRRDHRAHAAGNDA